MSIRMLVVLMFVLVTALPVAGQLQTERPLGTGPIKIIAKDAKFAIYDAPADEVFAAAVKAAASQGAVLFVHEKSGTLSFQTPYSGNSNRSLLVSITVTALRGAREARTSGVRLMTQKVNVNPRINYGISVTADKGIVKAFFEALLLELK